MSEERNNQEAAVESVQTMTCVVVLCADCGDNAYEEGPWHWDSLVRAIEGMPEWDFTDKTRPVCPDCRVKRLCAADGHVWTEWRSCGPHGIDFPHECGDLRYCERELESGEGFCGRTERRAVSGG